MDYKLNKSKAAGQMALTLNIEEKDLTPFRRKTLNEYRQHLDVPGFRKGKAPDSMIIEKVGENQLNAKTMENALPSFYMDSLKKEKVSPYGSAKMDVKKEDFPMEIVLEFAIFPEVKMEDWTKITVTKASDEVPAKDIQSEIDAILERSVEWQETTNKIKETDKAEIAFTGKKEDGTVFEKGQSSYPLVVGSGFFIPGFEEKLIGFKAGEKTEFDLTFPADYHHKEFQGMKAIFTVTIEKVYNKQLPNLDDEFVSKLAGKKMTAAEFKEMIEKQLHFKKQYYNHIELENKLLEEVAKKCILDNLSDLVIEDEIEIIQEEFEHKLQEQQLTLDKYLTTNKIELEQLKKDWRPQAHQRLKTKFALTEIAKEHKITISDQEVIDKIKSLPDFPKETKKQTEYLNDKRLADYAKRELTAFKTIKLIKETVTIKDEK